MVYIIRKKLIIKDVENVKNITCKKVIIKNVKNHYLQKNQHNLKIFYYYRKIFKELLCREKTIGATLKQIFYIEWD